MTLNELVKQCDIDPGKVESLSDEMLITYLRPIFPQTRPSEQRIEVVRQISQRKELDTRAKQIDMMQKFLEGKKGI